jgi:hypothetical protein
MEPPTSSAPRPEPHIVQPPVADPRWAAVRRRLVPGAGQPAGGVPEVAVDSAVPPGPVAVSVYVA